MISTGLDSPGSGVTRNFRLDPVGEEEPLLGREGDGDTDRRTWETLRVRSFVSDHGWKSDCVS